jgi:Mrp family chromosome partitioning ATPase
LLVNSTGDGPRGWSAEVDAILDRLGRAYRLVLIDGPPVLPAATAQRLAQLSDGVVLITRARRTPRPAVRSALARLAECDAPLIGTILNATSDPFVDLE